MLADNLKLVQRNIDSACEQYQRHQKDVLLLAVSKRKSSALIRTAYSLGQHDFGENYLQEAIDKQCDLNDLSITWHYIGQIQSNKTRQITEHFQWVHSVDRLKVAQRLSSQRPSHLDTLNICLQVNIDAEISKAGLKLEEVCETAIAVSELPNLRLRGLMALPKANDTLREQRASFAKLRDCLATCNAQLNTPMDTLSMGMSGDLEAAIAEGATIVRIGTAIFGARD